MKRVAFQDCGVCSASGVFCAQPVVVLGSIPAGCGIVGQCPRCLAFFCSRHAELAVCRIADDDLQELCGPINETGFVPAVLCCPFHQIPLGRWQGNYRLFLERQSVGSDEQKVYARMYIQDASLYTRRTGGFDFSSGQFSGEESTDWPRLKFQGSPALATIEAAFNDYDLDRAE